MRMTIRMRARTGVTVRMRIGTGIENGGRYKHKKKASFGEE